MTTPSTFTHALVRTPAACVVNGLRAGDHESPTYPGICAEHRAYVAALEQAGVAVEILPPLDAYPDAVFVEDPAFVLPEGAILLRPGAPTRLGEAAEIAAALHRRFARVLTLERGFADGGDILILPDEILIGLSARTDRQGAERFAELVSQLYSSIPSPIWGCAGEPRPARFSPVRGTGRPAHGGARRAQPGGRVRAQPTRPVRIVQTPPTVLHLKTACALLDESTVFATRALADANIFGALDVIVAPESEEKAANLLRINDKVLIGADYPRTAELLARRGYDLVALDVAEIRKIDAGLSCLSLRWSEPAAG